MFSQLTDKLISKFILHLISATVPDAVNEYIYPVGNQGVIWNTFAVLDAVSLSTVSSFRLPFTL